MPGSGWTLPWATTADRRSRRTAAGCGARIPEPGPPPVGVDGCGLGRRAVGCGRPRTGTQDGVGQRVRALRARRQEHYDRDDDGSRRPRRRLHGHPRTRVRQSAGSAESETGRARPSEQRRSPPAVAYPCPGGLPSWPETSAHDATRLGWSPCSCLRAPILAVAVFLVVRRREPGALAPRSDLVLGVTCAMAELLVAAWPSATLRGWIGYADPEHCLGEVKPPPPPQAPSTSTR